MAKRIASNYPRNINTYVPSMTFSADVYNETHIAEFGAPATLDADGILVTGAITTAGQTFTQANFANTFDGSSTSLTTTPGKIDAPFGRALTVVCAGSNTSVVTIYGRDYLGQAMAESFTCNGATAVQGKKAFKYVDRIVNGTGGSTTTLSVGWSDYLGFPYKSQKLLSMYENGEPTDDEEDISELTVTGVDTAGTGVATFIAPISGYVVGWRGVNTTAMTTAASAMAMAVNAVAKTAGNGSIPISAIGLVFGKDIAAASWVPVSKGDSVTLTSDGGGTAGVSDITMTFSRGVVDFRRGSNTTPQVLTSSDSRGVVKPVAACNGTNVYEGYYIADITNLHGFPQVIA